MTQQLHHLSTPELMSNVRNGVLSPVKIVDTYLNRIDERNNETNAFIDVYEDDAREAALEAERAIQRGDELGVLHGLP